MDTTDDLTTSHDLIKDGTPEQWSSFEEAIKMMEPNDLAAVADRLGVTQQQTWQDYCNEFSDFEWYQFCEAYQHVMYQAFTLPS